MEELCVIPYRRVVTLIKGGQKFQVRNGFPIKSIYPIIKNSLAVNPFWLTSEATGDPVTDSTHCVLECKFLPEDEATQRVGSEYDPETNELCQLLPGSYVNDCMNLILEFRDPLAVDIRFVYDGYRVLVKSDQTLHYKYL